MTNPNAKTMRQTSEDFETIFSEPPLPREERTIMNDIDMNICNEAVLGEEKIDRLSAALRKLGCSEFIIGYFLGRVAEHTCEAETVLSLLGVERKETSP